MRVRTRRHAALIVGTVCLAFTVSARAADPPSSVSAPASASPSASASASPPSTAPTTPKIADAAGTPVTITSSNKDTWIYLAKGDVPENAQPDPFERVGVAPLEIRLAPGVYTIESGNPTSTTGHARFRVEQGSPFHIDVRNGDATVRTLGAVFIGTGIIGVLLGVVMIVSISSNDSHFNRYAVGLPLLIGGGVTGGVGIGFSVAGATSLKMPTSNEAYTGSITVRF